MTPDELRERMRKNHAAGLRPVKVRIYAGDDDKASAKVLMIPGGKRTRWAAVAERIFTMVPTWHRVEWCDKGDGVLDFCDRDIGVAVGLQGDLADVAEAAGERAGVNLGQQLAGFGGLLQLVVRTVEVMRSGDRALMEAVAKTATETMKIYAGRVEGMERNLDKQIQLTFALARRQAQLAVRGAGGAAEDEGSSMSDEAMMRLADGFMEWIKGGQRGGPSNGANGAGGS